MLAIARHPINSQVLDYFDIYNKLTIDELKKDKLITQRDDLFVINNYFRNEILAEIDDDNKQALRKNLIKFYNSQLPLKPSERLLLISRTTMRTELQFHSSELPTIIETKEEQPKIISINDLI